LIAQPIILLGLLGYLLYLNWTLCLMCLLLVPLVGYTGRKVGGSARRNQFRLQSRLEQISNHIIETLRGLRLAHAFGQTSKLKKEFSHQVEESYRHQLKLCVLEESVGPTTKVITAVGGGLISLFGAYLVQRGHLTMGALSAFFVAAGSLSQPLRTLNDVSVKLQMVLAAAKRLHDFLIVPLDPLSQDQSRILNAPAVANKALGLGEARLEMSKVSYRYPLRDADDKVREEWALRSIDFALEPGRRIALVGASGAGKSTLSYLALRFLDPSEGAVRLAGRDAREWDLREYRAAFSYVSQDVFLFNRSVRDNLLFAREGASDSQIFEALERANIRDFIEKLPQGLDTTLGEQASKLSGGEKQRLSIARAFLRASPILILDEATSQLDADNERAVQRALNDLMKTRSAIIIAHRLSTIREVDEIFVMGGGEIIERGSPAELLAREHGHFRSLWQTQHLG
jgi:subfamily B ATP-binding cassette protein MsbA